MAIFAVAGVGIAAIVGTCARRWREDAHHDDLRRAHAEIARWEARWTAARECLLGKPAPLTRTRDALAIGEMHSDPWEAKRCAPVVGKLTREPDVESGDAAVEAAWRNLDKAAAQTAEAFTVHILPSTRPRGVDDPLPAALDSLDAAYVALRAAAKLPPLEPTAVPLRTAQLVLIHDEGVESLELDTVPSAHGLVVFGKVARRDVQIVLTIGGVPRVENVGAGSLRSLPALSWGAVIERDAIHAGFFDSKGLLSSDFEGQGVLPATGTPAILAALGTATLGTLVFTAGPALVLAHLEGHAITAAPAIRISSATSASDVDGRAAVVWSSAGNEVRGRILRPGDDGIDIELPEMPVGPFCLTERTAWARTSSGMVSFDGDRARLVTSSGLGDLAGCAQHAALVRDDNNARKVFVCTDDCRRVDIPPDAPRGSSLAIVGDELFAIAMHGGVLGVWRAGAAPVYYTLPEPIMPATAFDRTALAMSDGTVIDVLSRTRSEYVLIRVPAR
jgi:hypothetical protein